MILSKNTIYKYIFLGILLPLFARFLTDNFGVSYIFMPVFDVLFIILLVLSYRFNKTHIADVKKVEGWLIVFLAIITISILTNGGTSLSNFFYESRPYLRMIIAMLTATLALKLKDMEKLYKYAKFILYVNVVAMLFQYTVLGLRQDIIGGTFGNNQGCNSIQNLLCIFVFTISMVKYLYRNITLREVAINTISVILVTVLAELNVLLMECVIIFLFSIVLAQYKKKKLSIKKVLLIVFGIAVGIIGVKMFIKFNPDRVFLLSFDNILEYLGAKDSSGVYRISRVKVFHQLGQRFFSGNTIRWLFGYGVGNCSTHSAFYELNKSLQYDYFSSSMVFLQTGLIGVIVNLGVLVSSEIYAFGIRKDSKEIKDKIWSDISIVFILLMIIMFFYNTTLRDTYTAFLAGIMIAVPFMARKELYN